MPRLSNVEIRNAVIRALERMKVKDAHLFHIDVNENTLTQRLALYLQNEFADWHVDCEYNRDGRVPKRLDALKRERRTRGDVFPDIIVHKRGPAGPNLLVIEAKKSSELTREDERFDYLKLRAYQEEFGYRSTAFIVFGTDADAPTYTADFELHRLS